MGVNTEKFIRKPLYVDGVRLTAENFDEIAAWCQGEVLTDDIPGTDTSKKYIKVRVHNPKNPRQTKAFVGDWLLYTERGYKVYTNKAFRASFDPVSASVGNGVIQETHFHSSSSVPDDQEPGDNVGEIEATLERTPEAKDEPIPATPKVEAAPQAIADVEQQSMVSNSDTAPPQTTADGRRVLTQAEQREMDTEEVAALLREGQTVLEQDLVA